MREANLCYGLVKFRIAHNVKPLPHFHKACILAAHFGYVPSGSSHDDHAAARETGVFANFALCASTSML